MLTANLIVMIPSHPLPVCRLPAHKLCSVKGARDEPQRTEISLPPNYNTFVCDKGLLQTYSGDIARTGAESKFTEEVCKPEK